jgi:hypothetical protein
MVFNFRTLVFRNDSRVFYSGAGLKMHLSNPDSAKYKLLNM